MTPARRAAGMNLDNGACGPEGCEVNGTFDHGHSWFVMVTTITTLLMATFGYALWRAVHKYL